MSNYVVHLFYTKYVLWFGGGRTPGLALWAVQKLNANAVS